MSTEQPDCFNQADKNGDLTLLKIPDSDQKIAEGGLRLKGFFKVGTDDKPLITVVTVVYDGAEFLENTIKSVIEQTYDNLEYIVVDGGSTDGTLDIIRKYEHAIDYWVSEPDDGIYDAMNKAIDLSSGDWMSFMNSGDRFYEVSTLTRVYEFPNQYNNISVIYGDHEVRYPNKKRISIAGKIDKLWKGSQFCHQSTLIRVDFHKKNKYSLEYKMAADFKLFWDSRKSVGFCYVNFPLSSISNGGLSDTDRTKVYVEFSNICSNYLSSFLFRCNRIIFKIKKLYKRLQ